MAIAYVSCHGVERWSDGEGHDQLPCGRCLHDLPLRRDSDKRANQPGAAAAADVPLFDEALGHAERANVELRELAQGILPSVLARGGLATSVEELTERLRLPVTIDVTTARFRPEIEANAYFVVAEALTNLAKHSRARGATVAGWSTATTCTSR